MLRKSFFLLISFVIFAGFPMISRAGEEKQSAPWKITGELEEACKCDAACPCWFGNKPTHMNCGGDQVLFIESTDSV